VHNHH